MKKIVSMILLVFIAVSCQKQHEILENQNVDEVKSGVKESALLELAQSNFAQLSIANPAGQSSLAIPIPGTWNIKQEYLNQYVQML